MPMTTVTKERAYSDEAFTASSVFKSDHSKVVCGYFEPGQFIPVHAPESDLTVTVQSGSGVVRDGAQSHEVQAGSVVVVPAGQKRGIRAEGERLEAVLVTAPPPTDAEHEPVHRGLERDEFEPELRD